jgi:hypothetical protein
MTYKPGRRALDAQTRASDCQGDKKNGNVWSNSRGNARMQKRASRFGGLARLVACAALGLAISAGLTVASNLRGDSAVNRQVGVTSIKGFFSTLRLGRLRFPRAKRPELALGDSLVRMPVVVPGQVDVVPGERRQVL